jgi:RNA polymerase sigma-70 factor (ECF subfamily)
MPGSSETELDRDFARLAIGDRSAFPAVFRALWPPVQRFCRRYLGADADADDAAQRALERVFAQAADYDPSRPALAWVLSVAHWECRTVRRRAGRRAAVGLPDTLQSAGPAPDEILEQAELSAALAAAIEQLPAADQAILATVLAADERGAAGDDATYRKRKQRAIHRLRETWRRLYGT